MSMSATTMGCLNLIEKEHTKISSLVVIPFVTSVTLKLGHGQQLWRKYEAQGLVYLSTQHCWDNLHFSFTKHDFRPRHICNGTWLAWLFPASQNSTIPFQLLSSVVIIFCPEMEFWCVNFPQPSLFFFLHHFYVHNPVCKEKQNWNKTEKLYHCNSKPEQTNNTCTHHILTQRANTQVTHIWKWITPHIHGGNKKFNSRRQAGKCHLYLMLLSPSMILQCQEMNRVCSFYKHHCILGGGGGGGGG